MINPSQAQFSNHISIDPHLFNWITSNISPTTRLPYSFFVLPQDKKDVYVQMGDGGAINASIERVITEKGLDIYDGAVYQMVLTLEGSDEHLMQASLPFDYYWQGMVGKFFTIRSGYPINKFIYDLNRPDNVTSDMSREGERGFIFRIINADGNFLYSDPLTGETHLKGFPEQDRLHWVDWKPVAGENAWVVMAAMQYYRKTKDEKALRLSEELARCAMILQAPNGGIRMAPMGTSRTILDEEKGVFTDENWWYKHISTENNISWYAAFRMLYAMTGNDDYKKAMEGITRYLQSVWDPRQFMFHQGAYEIDGVWIASCEHFALDVQTWVIGCLGPMMIDAWLGQGVSFKIWQNAKARSGVFDERNNIIGVGYTDEHDRISVEWSAGAILALQEIGIYYANANPEWSAEAFRDKISIRRNLETLHYKINDNQSAFSYSSRRGWIPFGWNSHDPRVMSMASTGWMVFVDAGINPFRFFDSPNDEPQ